MEEFLKKIIYGMLYEQEFNPSSTLKALLSKSIRNNCEPEFYSCRDEQKNKWATALAAQLLDSYKIYKKNLPEDLLDPEEPLDSNGIEKDTNPEYKIEYADVAWGEKKVKTRSFEGIEKVEIDGDSVVVEWKDGSRIVVNK